MLRLLRIGCCSLVALLAAGLPRSAIGQWVPTGSTTPADDRPPAASSTEAPVPLTRVPDDSGPLRVPPRLQDEPRADDESGPIVPAELLELPDGRRFWVAGAGQDPPFVSPAAPALPLDPPILDEPGGHAADPDPDVETDEADTLEQQETDENDPGPLVVWRKRVRQVGGWFKRVEVGGRFIDGNRNDDFLNVSADLRRESDWWDFEVDGKGYLARSEGQRTDNRWVLNGTSEFHRGKRWFLFKTSRNEYDQFENLDYRGTLSAGPGFRVIDDDERRLVVRAGPGVTYEKFRDPDDERATGDVFGQLDVEWPVYKRLAFEGDTSATHVLYDDIFRLTSNSALLLPLDEKQRWNLKLNVRVEYNSQPNRGRDPIDYITSLLLVYQRK